MPFKPPPQPTCARCNKTVYQVDQMTCLDKIWHKACFTCEVCKLKLTMNTYKGFEKLPYCKTHYPTLNATSVSETPESLRLKKQTERQSVVSYHKAYEEGKGHYTASATDPTTERVKAAQNVVSTAKYDQRGTDAAAVKSHGGHDEAEDVPPPRKVMPTSAPAPQVHHHAPEPEAEAEPEPEQHHEAPHHEAPASSGGDGVRYKALYDYDAADPDEVSFKEGDAIINAAVIDEGWMRGTVESTGATGMLPSNYVEPE